MKILPQAGDLVRPVFLELVQTTGTDTTYCRTTYGCGLQPMVVIPVFAKNGKFWKKWKYWKNGKYWKKWKILEKWKILPKNGKYWKLAVGAFEC